MDDGCTDDRGGSGVSTQDDEQFCTLRHHTLHMDIIQAVSCLSHVSRRQYWPKTKKIKTMVTNRPFNGLGK